MAITITISDILGVLVYSYFHFTHTLISFFKKYLFIYLAASGLSCGTRDLPLRRTGFSLFVARGFSLSS